MSEWDLAFNEMTLEAERDGNPVDLGGLYVDLQLEYKFAIGKEPAKDTAVRLAKKNSYSPVRKYLA